MHSAFCVQHDSFVRKGAGALQMMGQLHGCAVAAILQLHSGRITRVINGRLVEGRSEELP